MTNDKPSVEELMIQITELKKQNKQLQLNRDWPPLIVENSHRLLFENSFDSFTLCQTILKHDLQADFIYLKVNPAFEHITDLLKVIDPGTTGLLSHIQEEYRLNKRVQI